MAQTKLKGMIINTIGELPKTGEKALDFVLTDSALKDVSLSEFRGRKVVLNIFPSIDTPTCAMSVRRFNEEAQKIENSAVLCISRDLPFAQKRFCGAEGLNNVITLSEMRDNNFSTKYGVRMVDGPLAGLLARAVLILDEAGMVKFVELVPEISQEPDYLSALNILK